MSSVTGVRERVKFSASGYSTIPGVLRWSFPNDCLKILDKVGLVKIFKVQGQPRPVHMLTAGRAFGGFVEPIALDHPFGTDTNILVEDPLQRPFVELKLLNQVINPGSFRMGDDVVHDLADYLAMRIPLRLALAQEPLRDLYYVPLVRAGENSLLQRSAFLAEYLLNTAGGISKP